VVVAVSEFIYEWFVILYYHIVAGWVLLIMFDMKMMMKE